MRPAPAAFNPRLVAPHRRVPGPAGTGPGSARAWTWKTEALIRSCSFGPPAR